jgi:hypothetical protein
MPAPDPAIAPVYDKLAQFCATVELYKTADELNHVAGLNLTAAQRRPHRPPPRHLGALATRRRARLLAVAGL